LVAPRPLISYDVMSPDPIGWIASAPLVLPPSRHIHAQWENTSAKGVAHWPSVGQMLENGAFTVTDSTLLPTAVVGHVVMSCRWA